jgi:hypothetical protein
MLTFWQWLETYFTFDPAQYNQLFDNELEKVIARTTDPAHRQILEKMRGFNWISYIAACVRNAGYNDRREVQEKTHDIVVKLLTGSLFTGFDQRTSGPMDLRFKRSVANAIKNLVEKEKNRRHYLPTVPIGQTFGSVTADELPARSWTGDDDEKVIDDFRQLLRDRLGNFAVAILDQRLAGAETKSLAGSPEVGGNGRDTIKRLVRRIKELAQEFAASLGDSDLLRRIEKAMASEETTVAKRRAAMATRRAVGA